VNDATGAPASTPVRRILRSPLAVAGIVILPLALAAVLLTQRPWAPVLDMAMTELRVRDVGGSHTPLIGLPGRIGNFPDQGSHPGPASFYLLAPFYRLAGASAYGLELGSIVINSATIGLIVWIGHRRAGLTGAVVLAALAAVAVRGYGLTVLTHPWNPYFPVLLWLLVLVAAWSVLMGDSWMAVIVVVGGSIAAQTHVPYLLNAIAICALVLGTMAWRMRDADDRKAIVRPFVTTVVIGAALWLPAFVDQLIRDPGNIRMLVRHFASEPPEPAIGLGTAVRLFFRHLDAPSAAADLFAHGDAFVHRSGLPRGHGLLGVIVFVLWVLAVIVAHRRRHVPLQMLNRVIAVALAAGAFSMFRIFGKVWYYLTLWAWGTMLLVVLSIAWTAWSSLRHRSPRFDRAVDHRTIVAAGAGTIVVCTAMSVAAAVVLDVPEQQLSDGLRAVLPATEAALEDGVGPAVGRDGRYLVFWQDAVFIGAQGYGLVNELERAGFDVGVHDTWRVPVTPQRVLPDGTYDAEVHLVSGVFVDRWREREGFVEVVVDDVRTDAEKQRFDELRQRVIVRLTELDRTDLLVELDENLFGASLDPDLPDDVIADMSEMLVLAEPVGIFLAPPGSSF
jgi:hypothetical protein